MKIIYENQLKEARAMVLRLCIAQQKAGWEEGQTEAEVQQQCLDMLFNWGLDPHNDREACKDILEEFPGVSLDQMRSNQEMGEAAKSELQDSEKELGKAEDKIKQLTRENQKLRAECSELKIELKDIKDTIRDLVWVAKALEKVSGQRT